jgi:hypothetical protein
MCQLIEEMSNEDSGSDSANEYLQKIVADIEKNPPADKNKGHEAIMQDLSELLYEAYHYEFNDFRNKKYATPKAELRKKLFELADNTIKGKYDN